MELKEAIARFKEWRGLKVGKSTVKGYDLTLRQFCLFVRNCQLEEIKLDHVLQWFKLMEQLEWEQNSFIPKAMALRKFFEFYYRQDLQVLNPWLIPVPRKLYRLPRIIDEISYNKLLSAVPVKTNDPRHIRNLAIIKLLWATGARNGEVCSLDIDDLDLNQQRAVIKTEKNRGSRPFRELYWTNDANESLGIWLDKRAYLKNRMQFKDSTAVFVSICSGALAQTSGQRFTTKGVGEMLRHYTNKVKIPYMNAHSFRHHFCHDIINKGGSAADVMNLAGHASLASSSIYSMMTSKELEQRYRLLKG